MSDSNKEAQRKRYSEINMDLFTIPDSMNKPSGKNIVELDIDCLHHLRGHQFELYSGQRMTDMVESVKANGVIVPIIVRPLDDTSYEILSGHNRFEAAKEAGLEKIPAIIRRNLTEEEAWVIAIETNLLQRSFSDMKHSERALALFTHHETIKKQGRRTDLIKEIEEMVNADDMETSETFVAMQQKMDAREITAGEYGLKSSTVAQYLRLNKLIAPLIKRLDNGEFAIRAADRISALSEENQLIIEEILDSVDCKMDIKKADALRSAAEEKKLDRESTEQILVGSAEPKPSAPPAFKLNPSIISYFFKPEQKTEEIEAIIIEALKFYFASTESTAEDEEDEANEDETD